VITFCTTLTRQTLANARVLAHSIQANHSNVRIIGCALGISNELRAGEPFDVVWSEDLVAETDAGQGHTSVTLATAPGILMAHALKNGADIAAYLDPRVKVYAPLEPLLSQARDASIILARRVKQLPDDGERPDHADLLVAGQITPSFLAASGPEGVRFVRWWSQGIASSGTPARWLELVPQAFRSVAWLDDQGGDVSFWNLHERPLERRGTVVLSGGQPLRLFDFSGFRPDRPYLLSELVTRNRPLDDPVLGDLCGEYAEEVRAVGWHPPNDDLALEARFGNGLPMTPLLRRLWAEAEVDGQRFGDTESPLAADAFAAWLREPAEAGAEAGVNRYLYAVYVARRDLQAAFPDLDRGGRALIAWVREYGQQELDLIPDLLPGSVDESGVGGHAYLAVNVFGYLRDTLGLAEAARLYITAIEAAGLPLRTTAVAPDLPIEPGSKALKRLGDRVYEQRHSSHEPAFNLVCLNGDHLVDFVKTGGGELLLGRVTIGHWAWETDILPPSWLPGFDHVDEIWVNSRFVAENLGRVSPVPVVVIPQAISVPDVTGVVAPLIGDGRFTFLFLFDFFSTLKRKNPTGLVDAFSRAFAPDEGPRLLLKSINEQFRPDAAAELREHIAGRNDIELVDRFLEPAETAALIARANCYVSLHRSEGFGLTLAESMALGTPVIATGYSGNMDFTTERNSYLVGWRPTAVGPDCDVYPAEGTWAEPDVEHAAELMRHVWSHPNETAEKAARARVDIGRRYAPDVAGSVLEARLRTLAQRRLGLAVRPHPPFESIERELRLDLRRGLPSQRRGTDFLRSAAMRLMLPFTVHERRLDRALLDALREVRADLERERARNVQTRTRLRRVEGLLSGPEPTRRVVAPPSRRRG
jgi:glycosyltransferase involved in cell wall biosynthesis